MDAKQALEEWKELFDEVRERTDRIWNSLTPKEKEKYYKLWKDSLQDCGESSLTERRYWFEEIFGYHNLVAYGQNNNG